jgi:hypothetical protein
MDQRHGYVMIVDDGLGLDLDFWRADLGVYDELETNLSYTDWHTLGIEILFQDGVDNDLVTLHLNGSPIYTGPSWESYYTAHSESVDRLCFDTYVDAAHLGNGLYIDNVLISDGIPGGVVPEPSTVAVWGMLGGLGLIISRRRRKTA